MKRTIFVLITLAAVIYGISGCKQNKNAVTRNTDGKINVTTTNFPPFDFVRQIGGDKVNLSMLLPPGAESHSFEPSPKDIITIQNSGIFIYTGGESDDWVDRILESMDTSKMKIIRMMDAVDVVEEEIVEGMEEDAEKEGKEGKEGKEAEEAEYDEHVWTSPKNAARIARAITDVLCEVDGANTALFRQNAQAYTNQLDELDKQFQTAVNEAKRKTIVFADRFPFRYFADTYGLTYYAAFPGCSTETEPSAATVAFLINKIKAEKIPVVFHLELSNERMADTISSGTGAKKLLLHACHNISKQDFDAGLGYLDLMRRNVENLQKALY